ncbi:MAG: HAMP domain-containing histidine kinase [Kiritimatiellae bacterium]|nr:HAMP domain-containing histidine kinase [Kiritimatiellia bacterium]
MSSGLQSLGRGRLLSALAVIVIPLGVLAGFASLHVRHIGAAMTAREEEALRQYAHSAARELGYQVSQAEGELLRMLDLQSLGGLVASLAQIELTRPETVCFALTEDGSLLYPDPAHLQAEADAETDLMPALAVLDPAARRREVIRAVGARKRDLLDHARLQDIARVHLPDGAPPLIVSLHRFRDDRAAGLLGFCWAPAQVEEWGFSAVTHAMPPGYRLVLLDAAGNGLFHYPLTPDASPEAGAAPALSATLALPREVFPWSIRVAPEDPTAIRRLVRRQVLFYGGALAFLGALIAAGIWMLIAMTVKEAELGRLKADFAANVSHELRTPLAMIRAAGDALAERPNLDRPRVDRYLGIIQRETHRLTDLVNTVLSFAKAGRKGAGYPLEPTNLAALVAEYVDGYRPYAEEQGFDLHLTLPAGPRYALANPDGLQLVLGNLLDNAVKFSREEKAIAVGIEESDAELGFSVRDRGMGIDAKYHAKIFESFFRIEGGLVKETRGTGIGLALVRDIVTAHNGRVELDSQPGAGATFTVWLPRPKG